MKVKELIELLQTANPEAPVLFDNDKDLYRPGVLIEEDPNEPVFIFKGSSA